MKPFKLLLFILLATCGQLLAQSTTKEFDKKAEEANEFLDNQKFDAALKLYLELRKSDSLNPDLNFNIGICYLNSRANKAKSIKYFEKAVECPNHVCTAKEDKAHANAFNFLGDAYHTTYRFDEAITSYEKYKALIPENRVDKTVIKEVDRKIEICKMGKYLLANPLKVKITNMGLAVNSSYADYSPVLSADEATMIFTSRRPGNTGGKIDEAGLYFEDIYITNRTDSVWSKAVPISTDINSYGNEASVGISVDGQIIVIYKDDNGDGNLYTTTLHGNNWSVPQKLNDNINTKSWEPSAFISADGNVLYFVSNKDGGYGGRDIYKSIKQPDGEWAKATNLGATINTPYDEDAPFIHPDGVTLYFSSNGHKTMGGFDIFSSVLISNNEWTVPENIGYPINSTDDDVFYKVSPDNKTAYYSSFKSEGLGEKDNYVITFTEYKQPALNLFKGLIIDPYGKVPEVVEITVTDNETGETVGVYHTNSITGKYLFILPPGKNYNISYEADGFLFHSENMDVSNSTNYYLINKAIQLQPLVVGSKIVLNNIFFDFDKATLRKISTVELNKLFKLLTKNQGMVVEISGHTDSKGSHNYNILLAEQRAKAVVKYLIDKGINAKQMIAKGYGETKPMVSNTNADGSDNAQNRQLNRRVELKIIKIKGVRKQ